MSVELFHSLTKPLQRRIDRAFDAAIDPNATRTQPAKKRQPLDSGGGFLIEAPSPAGDGGFLIDKEEPQASSSGGGFVVEDSSSTSLGGGFVIEDEVSTTNDSEAFTHIPLSLIPSALQALDLPPDDEEILAVFRNAASGWSSATNNVRPDDMNEEYVSRDDWRSVCAVLLEHEDKGTGGDEDEDVEMGVESEDDGESDEYNEEDANESFEEAADDSSEDEYIEGTANRRRTRNTMRRAKSSSSPPPTPKKITPRQQQTCLEAFSLFFPTISKDDLPKQRIMIKDIQRVAKLLGEKLKAEEIVEMLEMFSSSPDKSMDLGDFSRMMASAKLA